MDDVILVPLGNTDTKFNGLITTNEVGGFIWECISKGFDEDVIVRAVTDEYEVSQDKARADLDEFLAVLRENGIIE